MTPRNTLVELDNGWTVFVLFDPPPGIDCRVSAYPTIEKSQIDHTWFRFNNGTTFVRCTSYADMIMAVAQIVIQPPAIEPIAESCDLAFLRDQFCDRHTVPRTSVFDMLRSPFTSRKANPE